MFIKSHNAADYQRTSAVCVEAINPCEPADPAQCTTRPMMLLFVILLSSVLERAKDILGEFPDVVVDVLMHQTQWNVCTYSRRSGICVLIEVNIHAHTHRDLLMRRWTRLQLVQAVKNPWGPFQSSNHHLFLLPLLFSFFFSLSHWCTCICVSVMTFSWPFLFIRKNKCYWFVYDSRSSRQEKLQNWIISPRKKSWLWCSTLYLLKVPAHLGCISL